MLMESRGTGVERRRLALNTPEATKPNMTQTTSAAMIHLARIEEPYFTKEQLGPQYLDN